MAIRLLTSTFTAAIVALVSSDGALRATLPPAPEHFVATTPCDAPARRFVGIAADTPCERITWQLALSGTPSRYTITAAYGMQVSSGPGLVNGGTAARLHGTWSRFTGTRTDPNAVVYRLTDEPSGRSAAFAKIGDNLLHPLNEDGSFAVGNAGWSYTLSRTVPVRGHEVSGALAADMSGAMRAVGVFEGRTPCQELARELGVPTPGDCFKLKWRLTLLQDAATGAPTMCKLEGTLYRDPLVGRWTTLKDPRANRVVYRLDFEKPATSWSFVKGDDNILFLLDATGAYRVGNDAFSYTLNRTAEPS